MHHTPRTMAKPIGILIAVSALGMVRPAEGAIIKGPHLQNVSTDRITILWEQETAGPGSVTVNGTTHPSATSAFVHEVVVTGLSPATTYAYVVDADGTTDSGSFTTAPLDPLAPFVFIAVGDNRSIHVDHQSVVTAMLTETTAHFLMNTGDMVSSGEIAEDWQFYFDIEYPLLKDLPWFPTIGNHEENAGALPSFYTDYLAPPTATSGTEAYYSFTYANSAFVVLDGHVNAEEILFGLYTDFNAAQKAWLDTVLTQYAASPAIQHIFVFTHEPPFSSDADRTGSHALRLLIPDFLAAGVDAVITGHDHYMEWGESPGGLRYFIMGGGGAPVYANENQGCAPNTQVSASALPWLDDAHTVNFADSRNGYMTVAVNNGQVDVEIKDVDGTVLDAVSWNTGDIVPSPDAGIPDAGAPDASTPADAGVPGPDSAGSPDAELPPDASGPGPDASPPPPDGPKSGCGCQEGAGETPWQTAAWLILLVPILGGNLRRRRRRQPQ